MVPRFNTAFPGALMLMGGLLLMYWALSEWGLFGLGDGNGRERGSL